MERGAGAGFSRFQRHAKPSPGLTLEHANAGNNYNSTADADANANANAGGSNNDTTSNVLPPPPPPPPCVVREQDQYMPIANVIRIMRRILPAHAKISDDAKETIQECVSEYISFITGEANERCQREQRKTITAEDVLFAMGKLGFDDYVEPLTVFLNRYRESESDRGALRGEPIKPSFHVGPHPYQMQGMFDPSMMGGFYRDGSGPAAGSGSSSQAGMAMYDPFAQFK